MKLYCKLLAVTALAFLPGLAAKAQSTKVEVPENMKYVDVKIKFTEAGRKEVQEKVDDILKHDGYLKGVTKKAAICFPLIQETLKAEGVPDELKYVAVQESSLNGAAASTSGAIGYWQFKTESAISAGLRVDSKIDERMHLIESTRAAAKYIKKHNETMNNWLYAMLAYNQGLNGALKLVDVKHAAEKKLTVDKKTHWYLKHLLAYYLAYSAAIDQETIAMSEKSLVVFPGAAGKNFTELSEETGVDYSELRSYNLWLKADEVPSDRDYTVLLPVASEKKEELMALLNTPLPKKDTKKKDTPTELQLPDPGINKTGINNLYPVITEKQTKSGKGKNYLFAKANGIPVVFAGKDDTMQGLADAGGLSKAKFLKINDLSMFDEPVAGACYYLKNKKKKGPIENHIVQHEETLWDVAQMYSMQIKHLRKKNLMKPGEEPQLGRQLWLKKKRSKNMPVIIQDVQAPVNDKEEKKEGEDEDDDKKDEGGKVTEDVVIIESSPKVTDLNAIVHVVKPGETLYSLSRQHNITLLEVKKWNKLGDDLVIKVGQELVVGYKVPAEKTPDIKLDTTYQTLDSLDVRPIGEIGDDEVVMVPDDILKKAGKDPKAGKDGGKSSGNKTGTGGNESVKNGGKESGKDGKTNPKDTAAGGGKKTEGNKTEAVVSTEPVKMLHVVKASESLYGISKIYKVSTQDLMTWNNLTSINLNINQELIVYAVPNIAGTQEGEEKNTGKKAEGDDSDKAKEVKSLPDQANVPFGYYKGETGDNLELVAYKNDIRVADLLKWNKMTLNSTIQVGKLYIVRQTFADLEAAKTEDKKDASVGKSDGTASKAEDKTPAYFEDAQGRGTHTVKSGETLSSISMLYGLSVTEIKAMNKLSSNMLSSGQKITVKNGTAGGGAKTEDTAGKPAGDFKEHTVTAGETLFSLARRYGVSIDQIKEWNSIGNVLSNGQTIRLYGGKNEAGSKKEESAASKKEESTAAKFEDSKPSKKEPETETGGGSTKAEGAVYHTVKPGETLYALSRQYGVPVAELQQLNSLGNGGLATGQTVLIKKDGSISSAAGATFKPESFTESGTGKIVHTVGKGDTLFSLSKKYNVPVSTIKALNDMTENTLSLGQKVRIK